MSDGVSIGGEGGKRGHDFPVKSRGGHITEGGAEEKKAAFRS